MESREAAALQLLENEVMHWSDRNADRYWQAQRTLAAVREIFGVPADREIFGLPADTPCTIDLQAAKRLRDMVFKTWDPPLHGLGSKADVAQSVAMQTLAWILGKPFLGELTVPQEKAIDECLEMFAEVLGKDGVNSD